MSIVEEEAGNVEIKPIPSTGHRYAADRDGNVYSLIRGGPPYRLKPVLCGDGYFRVSVHYAEGGRKLIAIHRLVGEVFLTPDKFRPEINHKNGIKTDNRASNLEWVTKKENMAHAAQLGLLSHRNRLNISSGRMRTAKALRNAGATYSAIADYLGCSTSTAFSYMRKDQDGRVNAVRAPNDGLPF